jgi:hypothetical protein
MSGHRGHRGAVLGIAAGGVLVGHWITYRLVSPHPDAREALLAGTGHRFLGLANDIGLALGVAALAAVILGRIMDHGGVPASPGLWFRWIAGFGVGAFVAMEVIERIASGAPLAELLHHELLPVGVAVQVMVAALSAAAIGWLLRAVDRIQGVFAAAAPLPRLVSVRVVATGWHPPLRLIPSADGIRGPPFVR